MKRILTLIVAAATLFTACKKEDKVTVSSSITLPALVTPVTATSIVVNAADSTQLLKIKWSHANYGVQAVISYFIQIDTTGRNFVKKVTIANTTGDTTAITYGAINGKIINSLHLAPNKLSTIDMRVGAAIYGKDSVFSKPINLNITTYKELAPPVLYVPGAYQGWDPGSALAITPVTTFAYEGYIYMNVGDQFKFTSAPDWNHVNYGDAGSGKLTTNGLAAGVSVPTAGYYKLNADIQNLTWAATKVQTFGIIGTATPQGWNASTAMTFSTTTRLWKITLNLVPGALKFRANDDWGLNYGPADQTQLTGLLIQTNDAISINVAGNYTVTMDMTQLTQKKYLYTVVKN
jgi:hypothetical protein